MHKQMPIERKRWQRLTGVIAAAAFLVFPHVAMALGLGPIQIKSSLNQPLKAEIRLIQARGEDVTSATAKVASQEAFERVGLSRNAATNNMQFRVIGDGSPSNPSRLLVTTTDVVKEPVLSFLVQLDWPSGKVIREYTVLLDPPVTPATEAVTPPQQRPVAKPTPLPSVAAQPGISTSQPRPSTGQSIGQSRTQQPTGRPVLRPEPPRASQQQRPAARPAVPNRGARQYGPVRPQETLWSIAYKLRPDANRITMDQMQIAILRANPASFENGNINRVIKGSVLNIPSTAEIMAVNPISARAEVARQRVSHQATARTPRRANTSAANNKTTVAAAPVAKPEPKADKPAVSSDTVVQADSSAQPAVKAGDSASTDTASEQPASSEVKAGSADADVTDARTEAEAALAAMQAQADKANAEESAATDDADAMVDGEAAADSETETAAVDSESEAESIFEDESMVDSEGDESAEVDDAQLAEEGVDDFSEEDWSDTEVAAGGSSGGLFGMMNIIGGIAILALLFGALWYNRKRRNKEAEAEFDQYLNDQSIAEVKIDDTKAASEVDAESAAPEVAAPTVEEDAGVTVTDVGTADEVLSEVDMHLAYGLHEECEAMLTTAIAANPDRRDLKLKMLEVHQAAGNGEAYQNVAETLKAELDENDPEWQKILEAGQKLAPGAALFAAGGAAAAVTDSDDSADSAQDVVAGTNDVADEASATDPSVSDFDEILAAAGVTQESETNAEPVSEQLVDPDVVDETVDDVTGDVEEALDFDALVEGVETETASVAEEAPEVTETVPDDNQADAGLEFNLDDLDFGLDEGGGSVDAEAKSEPSESIDSGLDFDLSELESPTEATSVSEPEQDQADADPGLDFDALTSESDSADVVTGMTSDESAEASDEASEEDFDALLEMAGQDEVQSDSAASEPAVDLADLEDGALIEDSDADDTSSLSEDDLDSGDADDEAGTKLDLARAYIDMGEPGMAESLLQEVITGGNASQKAEAEDLLKSSG